MTEARPSDSTQYACRRWLAAAAAGVALLATACGGPSSDGRAASPTPGATRISPAGGESTAVTTSTSSAVASSGSGVSPSGASSTAASGSSTSSSARDQDAAGAGRGSGPLYDVVSIVDGDTIKVRVDGVKTTVRLIGVDTPETHKPGVPVQCFGPQASSHMQSLVQSKQVQLVADSSQADKDKYGRLLRQVYVGGSTNVSLSQIAGGFGREYTYDTPYRYRLQFLAAQNQAKSAHRGTWGPPCNGFHTGAATKDGASDASNGHDAKASSSAAPAASPTTGATPTGGCLIKGNINAHGDKIAHAPGSATYDRTKITPATGERYFCTAAEAVAAGWRMASD